VSYRFRLLEAQLSCPNSLPQLIACMTAFNSSPRHCSQRQVGLYTLFTQFLDPLLSPPILPRDCSPGLGDPRSTTNNNNSITNSSRASADSSSSSHAYDSKIIISSSSSASSSSTTSSADKNSGSFGIGCVSKLQHRESLEFIQLLPPPNNTHVFTSTVEVRALRNFSHLLLR